MGLAVVVLIALVAGIVLRPGGSSGVDATESKRARYLAKLPSFVIINTDDQRWDTLQYMPHVHDLLMKHGVTFRNAFVVNPVCCPSRAALLTGTYSHTNGVYDNKGPSGGFYSFNDAGTLGTYLDQDYDVGLFGKYLNDYHDAAHKGYVPLGWDEWHAFDREGYRNYDLNENGSVVHYGNQPQDFSTGVLTDKVVSMIHDSDGPLMVYFTPPNPHLPSEYEQQDAHRFDDIPPWRPAAYDEADVSDKPEYVQHDERYTASQQRQIDDMRRNQLRSLQSVDRSVAEIVQALDETGRLGTTMIIYTSDNGMLWGEHRLTGKNVPYEESIRVPLVIRYDPWTAKARTDEHLVPNIDIAPTVTEMAKARGYQLDGQSLVPLLEGDHGPWPDEFLIEHYAERTSQKVPTYCAVRTTRYKYVDYLWGTDELYDLARDPHELQNLIDVASANGVQAQMERRLASLCRPRPPVSVDVQWQA